MKDIGIIFGKPRPESLNDFINNITDSNGNDYTNDFRNRVYEIEYLRDNVPLTLDIKTIRNIISLMVHGHYMLNIKEINIGEFDIHINLERDWHEHKK